MYKSNPVVVTKGSLIGLVLVGLCALRMTPVSAADEETNAASVYRRASSLLAQLAEGFQNKSLDVINNGWNDGDGSVRQLLLSNQDAISEFTRAAQLANCQFITGPIKKDATTKLPEYRNEVKVARLILMQARLFESEGKWDAAAENYVTVLRFASHLGQQKNTVLFSKLMEILLKELTFTPLEQYIRHEGVTAQDYQYLLNDLVALRQQNTGLEMAFDEEKESQKNTMRMLEVEAKSKGRYDERFFQVMYTEFDSVVDKDFGYLMTAYRENEQESYKRQADEFAKRVEQEAKPWNLTKEILSGANFPRDVAPGLIARIMATILIPQFSKVITRYYASLAQFDALVTAVAVRRYELEKARRPDSLQELVPTYLAELPTDSFNDFKSLKYEQQERGWIVYSVGPDEVDDHGVLKYKEESSENTGDIVVSSF